MGRTGGSLSNGLIGPTAAVTDGACGARVHDAFPSLEKTSKQNVKMERRTDRSADRTREQTARTKGI